jgi:hypothetical protein
MPSKLCAKSVMLLQRYQEPRAEAQTKMDDTAFDRISSIPMLFEGEMQHDNVIQTVCDTPRN